MQFISFESIDDFMSFVQTRFTNARVRIDDEFVQHIIDVYETNNDSISKIEFNVLHEFIETNLRQCVARNYMRALRNHHENEFVNLMTFANERTFHQFVIVEIDENEHVREIAKFVVNDNASIRVES